MRQGDSLCQGLYLQPNSSQAQRDSGICLSTSCAKHCRRAHAQLTPHSGIEIHGQRQRGYPRKKCGKKGLPIKNNLSGELRNGRVCPERDKKNAAGCILLCAGHMRCDGEVLHATLLLRHMCCMQQVAQQNEYAYRDNPVCALFSSVNLGQVTMMSTSSASMVSLSRSTSASLCKKVILPSRTMIAS